MISLSNQTYSTAWIHFISDISRKVAVSEADAWVSLMQPMEISEDYFTIGGLNAFFCEWLKENRAGLLKDLIYKHYEKHGLKRIFSMAYAASLSVSENIGKTKYNPLFICGSVGLGKTHLMQAIGNEIIKNKPHLKVLYCTTETFTNDFIEGIRFQNIDKVRKKYRNLNLLLIDDIQFLENKENTREEFFHTFNSLIQQGSQIVMTADRYPKEIKNIEERLISRFSAGMITKIEPPDFETRVAIIMNELKKSNVVMSRDVIEHIAHTIKTNVRDIKGVLTILEAEWSLLHQEITLESARIILKDILNLDKSIINVDTIIKAVSKKMNVSYQDILSERRDRDISIARQIAMYISREITDSSYPVIARYFDKNHASVIQACKRTKIMIEENMEMKQIISSVIRELTI
ncbi:hypothetical protein CHS0354_006948 [Potamilus streckersoni]|uniref:Chromosomal replication initiator protein DnaA n=1 Tax=Potamilus streckersoni TaxID=2493646 RepID=A0AAE0TEG8_9BIVA|nr:hypothetical protein CHS0354_006948 [Potamilus streckersoni]